MFDQNSPPPVRQALTTKAVAKYALLPGVFPRMGRLAECISSFLFMFTQLMGSVGLIDPQHPCLRYESRHDYSFGYVLALAWQNIGFKKEKLPQLFMFLAILFSLLFLVGGTVATLGKFFLEIGSAQAQYFGTPTGGTGITYNENQDWSYQFLDRIFGGAHHTGVDFWTNHVQAQNGWFTSLFAGMMRHYSQALLVIAAMMIMYLLVITIAEAARTGQPFGTRFDSVWAPIRLAMAIGLLIPISGAGYNAAQLIVFQASEWGSNLATNVWHRGLEAVGEETFITVPARDNPARFIHDMLLINICIEALGSDQNKEGVFQNKIGADENLNAKVYISGINGRQTYTFGSRADPNYCGQVVVPTEFSTVSFSSTGAVDTSLLRARKMAPQDIASHPEALKLLNQLVRFNRRAFFCFMPRTDGGDDCADESLDGLGGTPDTDYNLGSNAVRALHYASPVFELPYETVKNITRSYKEETVEYESFLNAQTIQVWLDQYNRAMGYGKINGTGSDLPYQVDVDASEFNRWIVQSLKNDASYGWTTAGVFYLRLANGFALLEKATEPSVVKTLPKNFTKFYAVPAFSTVPNEFLLAVCSTGLLGRIMTWGVFSAACNRMEAAIALTSSLRKASGVFVAAPITDPELYNRVGGTAWSDGLTQPESDSPTNAEPSGTFGFLSSQLTNMVKMDSDSLNPLGQVIRWGNNLMGLASTLYILAMTAGIAIPAIATLGISLGHLCMIPGFILAFYVPMQPFLYFMFAVIEWMISVVEAVIGVPLWALSFISLEGDALGKSMNGVKMLFELILRPTIIVIALLVSILIFSASIKFVNDSFMLFLSAKADADKANLSMAAGAVGGFAMMLIYMFLIYSLATSCFKLIDAIPNNFGRWLDLPQGFGAMIKIGEGAMSSLGAAVAGGAILKATVGGAQSIAQNAGQAGMASHGQSLEEKGDKIAAEGKAKGDAAMQARGEKMANRGRQWQDSASKGDVVYGFSNQGQRQQDHRKQTKDQQFHTGLHQTTWDSQSRMENNMSSGFSSAESSRQNIRSENMDRQDTASRLAYQRDLANRTAHGQTQSKMDQGFDDASTERGSYEANSLSRDNKLMSEFTKHSKGPKPSGGGNPPRKPPKGRA